MLSLVRNDMATAVPLLKQPELHYGLLSGSEEGREVLNISIGGGADFMIIRKG